MIVNIVNVVLLLQRANLIIQAMTNKGKWLRAKSRRPWYSGVSWLDKKRRP